MTASTVASVSNRPGRAARWLPLACVLSLVVLFFIANRPAYKGYFSDDDLDTLGWAKIIGVREYSQGLLTPKFSEYNFRPVGALYYSILGRAFDLQYRPYVAVLQAIHALNVLLIFFLLRQLGFSGAAAAAGTLFFAFHAAVMEAYWKPMFVFDALCAMLCLATLLLYARGRWIVALIPFWLAYKSKEIAVMLPFALLAYELLLSGRKWKRLIPYFLISLSFGAQAVWYNRSIGQAHTYVLRFTPNVFWRCASFYSSAIFFVPFAGLALLLLPLIFRDRRLYFGLIFTVAVFAPLLALPNRMLTVYWYVPMIGVAIAAAAVAERTPRWAIAAFFLLWLPLNFMVLREKRGGIVASGAGTRWFVTGVQQLARRLPAVKAVVYNSVAPGMQGWGAEGAIHEAFGPRVEAAWYDSDRGRSLMAKVPMAVISYDPVTHGIKGLLRTRDTLQSVVRFTGFVPDSQFGAGWYNAAQLYRWASPKAEATFYRPAEATEFEIDAFVPESNLRSEGPSTVTVFEDGHSLGAVTLNDSHSQLLRWKLGAGAPGDRKIAIVSAPVRHGVGDTRSYGIAITSLGYGGAAGAPGKTQTPQ